MAWEAAAGPARVLRVLLGLVLGAAVLAAAMAMVLAWRLAQGPLDVTVLVRMAGRLLAEGAPPAVLDRASIAWDGFNGGAASGLELRLSGLRTAEGDGGASDGGASDGGASVARADLSWAALPLPGGTVVPQDVALDGVTIRATRSADGTLRLDGDSTSKGGGLPDVPAELTHVSVRHARVVIADEGSGATVSGDIGDLDLRRLETGGIAGSATGTVSLGTTVLTMQLSAELRGDGGTHWAASLHPLPIRPAADDLRHLDPALTGLNLLDATVEAQASLDMSPALRPERASLRLSLGAGTLSVPRSAPVSFDRVTAQAAATWTGGGWQPDGVRLDPAELVLVGASGRRSAVRLTADAVPVDGHWRVKSTLGFDAAEFGDLPSLWPVAWGGHVRPWLTENVTAGLAHDAAFNATLDVSPDDPGRLRVTEAGGSLRADNVVIHWLRPVPPIERAQATLTITGPDDLVITIPQAQQGAIALTNGVLRFSGLSHKDQDLALTASLKGGVPNLVRLLREPRLHLLDAHPLPITGSAGTVAGTLSVSLPLIDHLQFDQVSIGAKGKLTGLALNGIVASRDLDRGNVSFSVTQDGLTAAGTAAVAGVPGRVEIDMDFRSGGPTEVTQRMRFVGRVDAAALAAQGVDATGLLKGAAVLDASYREQRNAQAQLLVGADLSAAGLTVAGWRKPPGVAAQASATVLMRHGRITGVPSLAASGPGLSVVARAEMANGAPRVLRLQQVVLGPTRLSGEVVFPTEPTDPLRITATGPVLDLAGQIKALSDSTGGGSATRAFVVDARIGQVILDGPRTLTDVAAHVEYGGGRLRSLQASTGGAERLRASITPVPNGRRVLVQAADTGAVLRGLDLTGTIGGGTLLVDASYDDRFPDLPLTGRVQLDGFGVRDAVVLGKLLQAVTIYGIVDALRGEGVYFASAQVPFTLTRNLLRIGPSRMSSASLGLTAEGWIDFERKALALKGTVIPAYILNAALGRLPLVGRLFSAEKGGGLFAAEFSVSGPTNNPGVSVNPFSLLTPGILRRLLD